MNKTQTTPIQILILSCAALFLSLPFSAKVRAADADRTISSEEEDLAPVRPNARGSRRRNAVTQDPAPVREDSSSGSNAKPFSVALMGGLTFGAGSNYTVTSNVTNAVATTSTDTTSGGVFLGGEAAYTLMDYFAAGLAMEWSKYNYQNTLITSDSEITFLVFPRVQYPYQGFLFWGGLGLGVTVTSVGTTTGTGAGSTPGPIIVGTSSSAAGFTFEPRFGADYQVTDQIFVGAMFAYVGTRGSVSTPATPTIVNGTTVSVQTTESFSRSWAELGVRVGMNF